MKIQTPILTAALLLAGCSSATPLDGLALDGAPSIASAPVETAPLAPPPTIALAPTPTVSPAVAVKWVPRMSCDIEVKRTSHGIRVTPVVQSSRSLSGEFVLTITKDGAEGSSDISQGGPFDAARGKRLKLSSSELSMERGARFRAVLKVRAGGEEICRDVRS